MSVCVSVCVSVFVYKKSENNVGRTTSGFSDNFFSAIYKNEKKLAKNGLGLWRPSPIVESARQTWIYFKRTWDFFV